jgi:uncharacterized membrane protein YcaP (DUF421 family)
VIAVSKITAKLSFDHKVFEKVSIGDVSILVEDGVLNQKNLNVVRLPRERVMSQLRHNRVVQLGEVKRLYMESTGDFSVVMQEDPAPGLSILPASDPAFVERMVRPVSEIICAHCGKKQEVSTDKKTSGCENCGSEKFTNAVTRG